MNAPRDWRDSWRWLDALRNTPMQELLDRYGHERRGNRLWPCPACGEENRSSKDRTKGPAIFNDFTWKCWRCGEGGHKLDLVSWNLMGKPAPAKGDKEGWHDFAAIYTGERPAVRPRRQPTTVRRNSAGPSRYPNARPPVDELLAFWASCIPVTEDAEVSGWLKGRGLSPHQVAARDLARALPEGMPCPPWASFMGVRWRWSGHRLILPAWGPGRPGKWTWTVRARNIRADIAPGSKIASAACGYGSASKLFYACPTAREMLKGEKPGHFILSEGGPDWLTWACRNPGRNTRGEAWGCLGYWNGSWTEEVGALIPSDSVILLRGHRDGPASKYAGQRYADRIERTLNRFVSVYRLLGEDQPDDNDLLQAGRLSALPEDGCAYRRRAA